MQPLDLQRLQSYEYAKDNIWTLKPISNEHRQLLTTRDSMLPVRQAEPMSKLLQHLNRHQHMLIGGPMGSGKTTQLVQLLALHARRNGQSGAVMLVVPRRVAAVAVAQRVRAEVGVVDSDNVVLLRMRNGDRWSDRAKIVIATEGMCLRAILNDPKMLQYTAIVFDEIHEKGAILEILMAWSTWLRSTDLNPQMRFAYMSATTDFELLSQQLELPLETLFELPALSHPITVTYVQEPIDDYMRWILDTLIQHVIPAKNAPGHLDGDVLIFLPGHKECERACERIKSSKKLKQLEELDVYPLYSDLQEDKRIAATATRDANSHRRIVCATNIAETSITIDGLGFVLDTCYQKAASFDPIANHPRLQLCRISHAQAEQRKGRVGRQKQGAVYRCITESGMEELKAARPYPSPKLKLQDYATHLLTTLAIETAIHRHTGLDNQFLEVRNVPSIPHQIRALDCLRMIGAVDICNHRVTLTEMGMRLSGLSLPPVLGASLLASIKYDCVEEMIELCAALSTTKSLVLSEAELVEQPGTFDKQKLFHVPFGDHFVAWNVFRAWRLNGQGFDWAVEHGVRYTSCVEASYTAKALIGQMEIICNKTFHGDSYQSPFNIPNIEGMYKSLVAGHLHQIAISIDSVDRNPEHMNAGATHYNWRDLSRNLMVGIGTTVPVGCYPIVLFTQARLHPTEDLTSISVLMPVDPQWMDEAAEYLKQIRSDVPRPTGQS